MEKVDLRSGDKKQDVIHYLKRIEILRNQTAEEVLAVNKKYVELELDANTRAEEAEIQATQAEAQVQQKEELTQQKLKVCDAQLEATALREQYILKVRKEMLEIQKAQICSLEKVIGIDYE